MKPWMIATLAAAALMGGLASVRGADEKPVDKPKPPAERAVAPQGAGQRPGAAADRMKLLAERLGLSKEQQDKLTPIFAAETRKIRELREDANLSPEQRREKMGKIREETRKKIKDDKILSEEQFKKWEEMQAEMRNRGRGGGPGGGGGRGGGGGQPPRPPN